jgi:Type III flagellar switch regulator (C-ring) FliN C-term
VKKLVLRDGALEFAERSCVPLSAACLVAGSVRERLAALLGLPVALCVLEPEIPNAKAWEIIGRRAHVYRVRGNVADAAIVLRERDAKAVAAAAFGEQLDPQTDISQLSPLERDVLDRVAGALAGTLVALCGEQREAAAASMAGAGEYVAYVELAVEQPISARIGIALSRDLVPEPVPALTPADLADIPLEASVGLDLENFTARRLSTLAPGDVVPITRPSSLRGSLRIGGQTLATGTCGVRDGRYALEIEGCVA